MEERLLGEWSEALTALREKRSATVHAKQEQKTDFSPAEYFEIAAESLNDVLEKWLELEKRTPTPDVEAIKAELDSVFQFEIDAIERDLADIGTSAHWDANVMSQARTSFDSNAELLRNKYLLKVAALQPATAAARAEKGKAKPAPVKAAGGSGGGSGMGMALMFLVGLLLGGGPSVYFWDLAKNSSKAMDEERAKFSAEKRQIEENAALIQGRFEQLATGELRSLPDIERTVEKIRREAEEKRKAVEAAFAKEKERISKRVPPGDGRDKALAANEESRNSQLAEIEAAAAQAVEPFEKQKAQLQELRAR